MRFEDVKVGQILRWRNSPGVSDAFVGKRYRVTKVIPYNSRGADGGVVYGKLLQDIGFYTTKDEYNCGYNSSEIDPDSLTQQMDLFE